MTQKMKIHMSSLMQLVGKMKTRHLKNILISPQENTLLMLKSTGLMIKSLITLFLKPIRINQSNSKLKILIPTLRFLKTCWNHAQSRLLKEKITLKKANQTYFDVSVSLILNVSMDFCTIKTIVKMPLFESTFSSQNWKTWLQCILTKEWTSKLKLVLGKMKLFFLSELKEHVRSVVTIILLLFCLQIRLNRRCIKMENQFRFSIEMTIQASKNDMKFTFTF